MADQPAEYRRRSTDQEGRVEVDIYKFLSDLADVAARTAVLERGHEELRKEVRDGNALTSSKIQALEAHLAAQDAEQRHQHELVTTQHKELLGRIDRAIVTATTQATSEWNREHQELIGLGRSLTIERANRKEAHKRLTRVGTGMMGVASSVLIVLIAGSLNRLQFIPTNVYLLCVLCVLGSVSVLIVWVALNQSEATDIEPPHTPIDVP